MLQLNKLYERRFLIVEQLFEKRYTKKGVRAFVKQRENGSLDVHIVFYPKKVNSNPLLGGKLFADSLDDLYVATDVMPTWTSVGVPENSVDDSAEKLALGYREVIL